MLTTSEQQELHQIGEDLRDADPEFAWRLTLFQGVLRWATPGRRAYLLAMAALAAALLRLIVAAERLLMGCAEAVMVTVSTTVIVLGDTAWLGWESGQASGHGARPVRDRPRSGGNHLP